MMRHMDCQTAQRMYDDLVDGRLAEPLAAQLRRHLEECSDCRVQRQRAMRLQQLLAIKRYEQPPPGYFEQFVAEFHRRLDAEMMRPRWWQRLAESIRVEVQPVWRYGLAGACGAALALGLLWQVYHPAPAMSRAAPARPMVSAPVSAMPPAAIPPMAWHPDASRPQYVLDRINITPASYETARVRF